MCSGSVVLSFFKQQRPSILPADKKQKCPTALTFGTAPLHNLHICHYKLLPKKIKLETIILSHSTTAAACVVAAVQYIHQNTEFIMVCHIFSRVNAKPVSLTRLTCSSLSWQLAYKHKLKIKTNASGFSWLHPAFIFIDWSHVIWL